MDFVSVLSCLCLLLATAASQYPEPCVSSFAQPAPEPPEQSPSSEPASFIVVPPLMDGSVSVMAGNGNMMSTGTIGYDALGNKLRIRNFGVIGNETYSVDTLMLFHQKVYYEIDWSTWSCKKMPLDASFIPMQVPPGAKLMGQAILGSSSSWGMGVLVNTWYGPLSNNGFYTTVFTDYGCIPMTFTAYTPEAGWTTISTFNWVLGTSNPMDYIVPGFCLNSKLEETQTPQNFFTVMESLATKMRRVE